MGGGEEVEGRQSTRLDGFTMAFFLKCWGAVRRTLWRFSRNFMSGKFEKSINATFVALIPQKS